MTQEIIEMAIQAGFGGADLNGKSEEFKRFAKLVADKKQVEMQERLDSLHKMYELVCQHRDILMAQQDSMIAALRGKMQ